MLKLVAAAGAVAVVVGAGVDAVAAGDQLVQEPGGQGEHLDWTVAELCLVFDPLDHCSFFLQLVLRFLVWE